MSTSKSEKSAVTPVVQLQPSNESIKPATAESAKSGAQPPTQPTIPNQREAVYAEILRVLKEEKVSFDGSANVKTLLTEERLKKVYERLAKGFSERKIALKETASNQKKLAEPKLMQVYIIGLVNNWVKRDPRLNGAG